MTDLFQQAMDIWHQHNEGWISFLLEPSTRAYALYLLSAAIIAALAYVLYNRTDATGRRHTSFLSYLVPRDVYLHKSHMTDLKIYALTFFLYRLVPFKATLIAVAFAYWTLTGLAALTGITPAPYDWSTGPFILLTFVLFLMQDFCTYWTHRIHHETPWLWPFHAVHHSAEVLTPFTLYRKHPVYDLISELIEGAGLGTLQGTILFFYFGQLTLWQIASVNGLLLIFNVLGSNLRHSHIWLDYGRHVDHVLSSPAMHQVHHSSALRHFNKNYAEVFSLWDWLFGTLYVPQGREDLVFGIADRNGNPQPQPYNNLREAMLKPFQESGKALRRALGRKKTKKDSKEAAA